MDSELVPGNHSHVFLVPFPRPGHVNPMLRLAKRLASKGLLVTLSSSELVGKEFRKTNHISDQPTPVGDGFIRFEFFDDGWPHDADQENKDFIFKEYVGNLAVVGKRVLPEMIKKQAEMGHPVACMIINPMVPWVYEVGDSLQIPCATLWVQSCASFSAYYHYYFNLVPFPTETEPEIEVQLPAMPLLKYDEVPSYLHPRTPLLFIKDAILGGLFKNLSKNFCVLMDTFHELEKEEIDYISTICPIRPVGPLFKNPKSSPASALNVTVDLLKADECLEWLDSKPAGSVVYLAFGTLILLKEEQITEIAHGLLNSGLPFLWVLTPPTKYSQFKTVMSLPEGFLEKAGDNGKVVKWCPQERVLAHPSLACFLTHCGWNSTLESLANGVPVIAFPRRGDQVTDAKYLVDKHKVGIRLCRGEAENRIVPREEVEKRVIEATSGGRAAELKENALKWKKLAADAVEEGGSSDRNLVEFVDEVRRRCVQLGGRS